MAHAINNTSADRPEEHQQRSANVSHHLLLQPNYVHAEAGSRLSFSRIRLAITSMSACAFCTETPGFKPHHNVVVFVAPVLLGIGS